MFEDRASIDAFLYFGYVPSPDIPAPAWLDGLADRQCRPLVADRTDLSSWTAAGTGLLQKVFQDTICGASTTHVVPLSGGLDSRAVLGGLLENLESREIQAVTFGRPGIWDYEIGRDVARAAGVRWTGIDLSSEEWTWDPGELVKTARRIERPVGVFDAYVNHQVPDRFGSGHVYWSGFMGDPLSGSHLLNRDSATWEQAQRRFAQRDRFSCSVDLAPPGFAPQRCLPPSPRLGSRGLCYDEQLDFAVRQQCLIRHIVLPPGYEYRTPFLHPEWVSFMLSVPRRYRRGQCLYKEILKAAYTRLFSLAVKANLGLPLNAPRWRRQAQWLGLGARGAVRRIAPNLCNSVSPGLNYMDFNRGLRRREDLRAVVYESIRDLKKRSIIDWMNIEDIWWRHQHGHGNHADALTLLASLEINLKAWDEAVV